MRPGDSTQDRLTRAQTLMAISSFDPVSRTTVARAALAGKDFDTARSAMAPMIAEGKRPTVRQCMLMAELEEAQHGDTGLWREWLARAARAPLDEAWIADGIVYDYWAPASPTTGRLDAFSWQVPAERLGPAMEAMPSPTRKAAEILPSSAIVALEHDAAAEAEEVAEPSEPAAPTIAAEPAIVPLTPMKESPPAPVLRAEARNSESPLFHRRLAEDSGEPVEPAKSNGTAHDHDAPSEASGGHPLLNVGEGNSRPLIPH